MAKLRFKASDVRRIVEHSLAAPRHRERLVDFDMTTGKAITAPVEAPSVLLVHDEGVYLMSGGEPRDIPNPERRRHGNGRSYVAYASGCDPRKDPDWYETARSLVGGDDFGESLPWAADIKARLDAGAKSIVLNFGKRGISLV